MSSARAGIHSDRFRESGTSVTGSWLAVARRKAARELVVWVDQRFATLVSESSIPRIAGETDALSSADTFGSLLSRIHLCRLAIDAVEPLPIEEWELVAWDAGREHGEARMRVGAARMVDFARRIWSEMSQEGPKKQLAQLSSLVASWPEEVAPVETNPEGHIITTIDAPPASVQKSYFAGRAQGYKDGIASSKFVIDELRRFVRSETKATKRGHLRVVTGPGPITDRAEAFARRYDIRARRTGRLPTVEHHEALVNRHAATVRVAALDKLYQLAWQSWSEGMTTEAGRSVTELFGHPDGRGVAKYWDGVRAETAEPRPAVEVIPREHPASRLPG